jgi:hypothetical protein
MVFPNEATPMPAPLQRSSCSGHAAARTLGHSSPNKATTIEQSDDQETGGRFTFANHDVESVADELPRGAAFPALADSAFRLNVGEMTVVPYDKRKCPWGWHVLKRVK